MSDWTTVAAAGIAGASGVFGALLGYLTAHRQAAVEIDRLRLEHGEEHHRHRQAVYHDFLDSAHRFHQAAGDIEPFPEPEDYQEWAREFEHNLTAVRLFGARAASEAALNLAEAISDAMGETPKYSGEVETRLLRAYEDTVRAMRLDTAPAEI
jgi:hypothetical protein